MFEILAYIIFILIIISLCVTIKLKNFVDILITVNFINGLVVIIVVILGSHNNNESFLDIAIIYALFSYISNFVIYKILSRS